MKTFDINRFWMALRWSLLTEKKKLVINFASFVISYFFLIMLVACFLGNGYVDDYKSAGIFCGFVWPIWGSVLTANLFSNLYTKQGRAAFFMLPASNNEKFWSRVAFVMIQSIVLSMAAIVVADILQMLVSLIWGGNVTSVITTSSRKSGLAGLIVYNSVLWESGSRIVRVLYSFGLTFWGMTSYILGGSYFRKSPFVKTTLCWIAVYFLLVALVGLVGWQFAGVDYIEVDFWFDPMTMFEVGLAVVSWGFTIFNVWLAMRLFNRKQIV